VRALYEEGSVPVREIAAIAGVSERTLYKYVAKHGWQKRYRLKPRGVEAARANRGRRWQRAQGFAPVKGAGGRFIRRADKDKPFAAGIKATDPAAARRAAAACRKAARLARAAEEEVRAAAAQAAAQRRLRERERAHAAVIRALEELRRYRAKRAKAQAQRRAPLPANDLHERALMLSLQLATDVWQSLR
jgi:hypothetical protein